MAEALGNASTTLGFTLVTAVGANIDDYDDSKLAPAVAAALDSDLVLVAVGDSIPISTGSCSEMSDSDTIDLPGGQLALIDAAVGTGKPVVVLLFNCRPTTFGAGPFSIFGPNNALLDRLPTVVVGWRPGEEAGHAMLDVLTGVVNPSGRLTQNWPRTSGAVKSPASPYLQHLGAAGNAYHTEPATPLFSFGHGLSYSNYTISVASTTPPTASHVFTTSDALTISGTVATSSPNDPPGKLSLLLYFVQRSPTKWTRYGKALSAFTKVSVPGGMGSTPFSLTLNIRDFEVFEPDTNNYEVHTGVYEVFLGGDVQGPMAFATMLNVTGSYTWVWDFTQ
jgi:beta-glucosidase